MPLRALGYITSALSVAQTALPEAQIQMVHTVHTAQRVNGLDARGPTEQAKRLAYLSRVAVERSRAVTHLLDPTIAPAIDEDAIAQALQGVPEHAQQKLGRAGEGKGKTLSYIAAHLLMHDTSVELQPLGPDDAEPIVPKRIISIGAQSERAFYGARMACRSAEVMLPDMVDETGQLFTKHVLPPYYKCREGEPSIGEITQTYPLRHPLEWGYDPLDNPHQQNASVQRDLTYLANYLQTQEDPEVRRLQNLIANIQRLQGEL